METILKIFKYLGFDPRILIKNFVGILWYLKGYRKFLEQLNSSEKFKIKINPMLLDRNEQSGISSGHYFHQDLFVASLIFKNNPEKHVDIGSRIDGFVAHVASYRKIEIFDIRELSSKNESIIFKQADFTDLDKEYYEYTDSISCLHAIEHFGLGRYGDSIDINGHIKGLNAIHKMLRKKGKFYFSVPIGPLRIEFNAHRVFSLNYLIGLLKDNYDIISFSYVDDEGLLHKNAELNSMDREHNFGCRYGCGIFELIKK